MRSITPIVIAGGLGTRLRRVCPDRPKVLAQVAGRRYDADGRILPPAPRAVGKGPPAALLLLAFLAIFAGLVGAVQVTRPRPEAAPGGQ